MAKLKTGDKVRWNTSQGETSGKVVQISTRRTKVGGTELKGSDNEPIYLVKSEKTGKKAGHKAGALQKKR